MKFYIFSACKIIVAEDNISLSVSAPVGVWPSGKATVFGIVIRRFESSHPNFSYIPYHPPFLCVYSLKKMLRVNLSRCNICSYIFIM
jgi:hypothetical protein